MKYKFENIDADTTRLTYKDKQFDIRKDVDLMRRMQSLSVKARTNMMIDLSKQGISKKDLVLERKEGNKTIYDNSNLLELEQEYYNLASVDLIDELCQKYFSMGLIETIQDIGLNDIEVEEFGKNLMSAFSGLEKDKFPSIEESI
jgi:predicted transcriptional regulator